MFKLHFCIVGMVSVLLVGCCAPKYVKQRETEYLRSCESPPLRIPPGLSGAKIGDDYVIPPAPGPRPTCPVSIVPPC